MGRLIKKIEHWLIGLLIFLVPTNLSLNLFKDQANVFGITVDYLIPKIFLSDIVIFALFFIFILTHLKNTGSYIKQLRLSFSYFWLVVFLLMSFAVSIAESRYPIAGAWYAIKIIQMGLLVFYFKNRVQLKDFNKVLIGTVIFQCLVGIIQWIQRTSIVGYYFLGETSLKTNSVIAKTGITGEIRPLPYGTTPHPNVLAGFIVLYLLILLTINRKELIKRLTAKKLYERLTFGFLLFLLFFIPIITLFLTQSVSAIIGLFIGLFLLSTKRIHWANLVAIVMIFLSTGIAIAPYIESTSISRRITLMEISLSMIKDNLWLGVGLNNFTGVMSDYGTIVSTTRFIQPVHNIYLLFLSETGLISVGLLLLIFWQYFKRHPIEFNHHLIPIVVIAVIGLADHYPLSLQTGMLLSTVSIMLALKNK